MEKLQHEQSLIQRLVRANTSRSILQLGTSSPPAGRTRATPASALSLQMPPALGQLLSQAKPQHLLLQQVRYLQTSQQLPHLPPAVQALLQPLLTQAQQPSVTPAFVNAWFATNPLAALLQPQTLIPTADSNNAFPLQQALPLLLLLLKADGVNASALQGVQQFLKQKLGLNFRTASGLLGQLLQDLQGSLQQVRLSQVVYADSSARQEPDYYLTLPWHLGEETHLIELLLKKRHQPEEDKPKQAVWLLSMRLQITRIGPILARVRWDGEQTTIMLYTDNDAASRWLSGYTHQLEAQLQKKQLRIKQLTVQTGRIPASLAPDPNQLVRVKV